MKFLSPEVALYLYKSAIQTCMEYCCHVWAGAPSWYLELLDKLQKWVLHLLSLLNPWLIIEMQSAEVISIGITLVDLHLSWPSWFQFLISQMLQGSLCQQFLSLYSQTPEFYACRMFPLTFSFSGFKVSEYPFKKNENTLKKHTSSTIYTFLYLLKCTKTKLSKS